MSGKYMINDEEVEILGSELKERPAFVKPEGYNSDLWLRIPTDSTIVSHGNADSDNYEVYKNGERVVGVSHIVLSSYSFVEEKKKPDNWREIIEGE